MGKQRKPKDRDFIETQEGLLFCVVGYLHPPDKYTAYLKYSPASEGRWQRRGRAYQRQLAFYHAHQVGETLDYLRACYPHYVHYCPVRDMVFSMVPQNWVRTYYYPEQRLAQVLAHPNDPLEEEAARAVEAIRSVTGIAPTDLGITGSILLGTHDPSFSDIDLIVYGRDNARRVHDVMSDLEIPGASPVGEAYLDNWCRGVVKYFGLTYEQAHWLVSRQWNFCFGPERRPISLHPARLDTEIVEEYGDHRYREVGMCRLQATVSHDADAVFLPALYGLEGTRVLEGPAVEVTEICAYEGLFGRVASAGQEVEARGKLEEVDGGLRYRLVIGSSKRAGPEYLLPLSQVRGPS